MYHFTHQPLLNHNVHNEFHRFSGFDHEKTSVSNQNSDFNSFQQNNVSQVSESQLSTTQLNKEIGSERTSEPAKKEKILPKKVKKGPVDTSNYTVEERLVAAAWVHERKHTKTSISQIKQDFRQRFGREPPAKNTLLVWERKLFSTGSVHDAPRPGRPAKRSGGAAAVLSSVSASPALSLRARARALGLPRTTLRTMLLRELGRAPSTINKDTGKKNKKPKNKKTLETATSRETHPVLAQNYFQAYT